MRGVGGEEGVVTSVEGERVTVKLQIHEGCDKCRVCTKVSSTEMMAEAFSSVPVSAGDRVILSIRPGIIVKSAAVVYLVPLAGLVLGYFAGKLIFQSISSPGREELIPAAFSFLFFFASFIPVRMYDRRKRKDLRFRMYIKENLR